MRWSATLPALALGVAVLCGCTTTDNPIGISDGVQTDTRLAGGWKGVFADRYAERAKYYVFFLPNESGGFLAIVVGGTPEAAQWATYEVVTGKAGQHTIANMRSLTDNGTPSNDKSSAYFPSLYRFGPDGSLNLLMLSEEAIGKEIRGGSIAGSLGTGEFGASRITADLQSLDAFFAEAAPMLFTQPYAILQRID